MGFEYVLLIVLSLIFILFSLFYVAFGIAKELIVPKKQEKKTVKDKFPHEKRFKIQSSNGYPISCLFIPSGDGTDIQEKTVIILHGFGSDKESASEYAPIFLSLGYSVLLPDMRAHGESGGNTASMGFYEKEDIRTVVRWIKDCYGKNSEYALFGLAAGGCAALAYAAEDPNVKFVITDSAFADLPKLYKGFFKTQYKVKTFPLLNIVNLIIKKMGGFSPKDVRPIAFFENPPHDIPLMLIHGDSDLYIPTQMSVDIYNSKEFGLKTLYLAPDCEHLEAYVNNKEDYVNEIHTFIESLSE